jgi:sugar phosphate isomerase/epimerase
MKYAITLSSFRNLEPFDTTLSKLAGVGFDSVEMYGEPSEVDTRRTLDVIKSYGMTVCGVTGMWGGISSEGWKRRLLSQDPGILKAAMDYVRDCVRLCNEMGGRQFNVCLFADEHSSTDRTHKITSDAEKEKTTSRVIRVLAELSTYSQDLGVTLLLEPLNRYSTPYCATAKDAARIRKLVDMEGLKIMLDTFHMNIEEDSFDSALQSVHPYLRHMHFADNNRKMPGFAHIDFAAVSKALARTGFNQFVTFEPNIPDADYESDVKSGFEFTRRLFAHQEPT